MGLDAKYQGAGGHASKRIETHMSLSKAAILKGSKSPIPGGSSYTKGFWTFRENISLLTGLPREFKLYVVVQHVGSFRVQVDAKATLRGAFPRMKTLSSARSPASEPRILSLSSPEQSWTHDISPPGKTGDPVAQGEFYLTPGR